MSTSWFNEDIRFISPKNSHWIIQLGHMVQWIKHLIGCWLLVWVLCWLFNGKSIFIQIISSISNNSVKHEYTVQLSKTFLFQAIQFIQTVLIQLIQFSISTNLLLLYRDAVSVFYSSSQLEIGKCFWMKSSGGFRFNPSNRLSITRILTIT